MLFVGSDTNIELLGVKTEDGAYLTTGAITCAITDPTGASVATVTLTYLGTAVTVAGSTYSDGNWRGTLSGSNSPALVAGTIYKLVFSCTSPAISITRYETAQVRLG